MILYTVYRSYVLSTSFKRIYDDGLLLYIVVMFIALCVLVLCKYIYFLLSYLLHIHAVCTVDIKFQNI